MRWLECNCNIVLHTVATMEYTNMQRHLVKNGRDSCLSFMSLSAAFVGHFPSFPSRSQSRADFFIVWERGFLKHCIYGEKSQNGHEKVALLQIRAEFVAVIAERSRR